MVATGPAVVPQPQSERRQVISVYSVRVARWTQTNGYAAFGHRRVASRSGPPALTGETPQSDSRLNAENRLVGWDHDAAGNLTTHPSRTFPYDDGNPQASAVVRGEGKVRLRRRGAAGEVREGGNILGLDEPSRPAAAALLCGGRSSNGRWPPPN